MSNQSQKSPLQENLAQEEEEQQQQQQQDENLQEPSKEPPGGGGGGDERKVATLPPSAQKTSIARNGPVLKPHDAAMSLAPRKEVADGVVLVSLGLLSYDDHEEGDTSPDEEQFISRSVSNLKPKSLTAKNFASPRRLPLGTPAKRRLFENSANDGASQGKEKKIKNNVHGEDGGGSDENPRDDSASI